MALPWMPADSSNIYVNCQEEESGRVSNWSKQEPQDGANHERQVNAPKRRKAKKEIVTKGKWKPQA
jgi:hypothetical protein